MSEKLKSVNIVVPLVVLVVLVSLGLAVWFVERDTVSTDPSALAQETLSSSFVAVAEISYQGVSFVADCNKTDNDAITLTLTEPASLAGITLSMKDEQSIVTYGDLSVTLDNDSILGKTAASLLLSTVNAASAEQGVTFELDGNTVIITGENEDGIFNLRFDPTDGGVITFNLPDQDFSGTFYLQTLS